MLHTYYNTYIIILIDFVQSNLCMLIYFFFRHFTTSKHYHINIFYVILDCVGCPSVQKFPYSYILYSICNI